MKSLILTVALTASISSFAGVVECMKVGRYLRPANNLAIKLALTAGSTVLKTCTGDSFLFAVKTGGHTTKIVNSNADRMRLYKDTVGKKKAGKTMNAFLKAGK